MKEKYFIGCSGYYYSNWKGKFYPKTLKPTQWLEYYSAVFNTVELNATFYRPPGMDTLKRYVEITPPEFTFSVKANRLFTHMLKLHNCRQQILDFTELTGEGLGAKLSCILFQFPASFVYTQENMDLLLEAIPHSSAHVVEFRHESWWNPEVALRLRETGLTFGNVDYPGLDAYIVQTSDLFYFRFHGSPELFKSAYSEHALETFVHHLPPDMQHYRIYFNNTYYEAGYSNAMQLQALMAHEQEGDILHKLRK